MLLCCAVLCCACCAVVRRDPSLPAGVAVPQQADTTLPGGSTTACSGWVPSVAVHAVPSSLLLSSPAKRCQVASHADGAGPFDRLCCCCPCVIEGPRDRDGVPAEEHCAPRQRNRRKRQQQLRRRRRRGGAGVERAAGGAARAGGAAGGGGAAAADGRGVLRFHRASVGGGAARPAPAALPLSARGGVPGVCVWGGGGPS